jgi:phenylpropionate dioxygenase-like ring-hydroxylating dioxygenase large terminal subunit
MLTGERNELLTRTSPGTPMGELLRRYWQPVGLSDEVTPGGKPKQVRVMSEDLVVFRDDTGRPGLIGLHCSHRLTSLAYGRVEDGGIRCPFHGWLYDIEGRCLEQPTEPEPNTYKDQIRHLAYPCQEIGGLILAYMGPREKMPLLPRYEVLVREEGSRKADYYLINSNYLQNLEGAVDTVHVPYLHMDHWSKMKHRLQALEKPTVEFKETDYGLWQKTHQARREGMEMGVGYSHFVMPAGWVRRFYFPRTAGPEAARFVPKDTPKLQSWYVPIDDTHTKRFQVAFVPMDENGGRYEWPEMQSGSRQEFVQPGPENDYLRDYGRVDTISGIPVDTEISLKGLLAQDSMVNETQGSIVDRSREHLMSADQVLVAMRAMLLVAVHDVQSGRDPKHIVRGPDEDRVVDIRDW